MGAACVGALLPNQSIPGPAFAPLDHQDRLAPPDPSSIASNHTTARSILLVKRTAAHVPFRPTNRSYQASPHCAGFRNVPRCFRDTIVGVLRQSEQPGFVQRFFGREKASWCKFATRTLCAVTRSSCLFSARARGGGARRRTPKFADVVSRSNTSQWYPEISYGVWTKPQKSSTHSNISPSWSDEDCTVQVQEAHRGSRNQKGCHRPS